MPSERYEARDANPIGIMLAGIGMALFFAIMLTGLQRMFRGLKGWQTSSINKNYIPMTEPLLSAARTEPPEPRLQKNPQLDFELFYSDQMKVLHSSGWIDEKAGIGRIPIERAMEILSHGH